MGERSPLRREPDGGEHEEERIFITMWKPNQSGSSSQTPPSEPVRPVAPATPSYEPAARTPTASAQPVSSAEQATIGKSLVVKGEVTGSESLYIDGKIEGAINLPGNRVTVGRNGQVAANITAREIVVLGKVRGNVNASDRVDIRSEGSLTGDVTAQRISIEDGAFFKGGIDIRKPGNDAKPNSSANSSANADAGKPVVAQV
jgi:cytoskeletal protein CcmA (bactofilin family)